uniref:Uncharacterized protein n=1 Tax=virus sp. ctML55 TaxID=2827627 RepID=A0A8S5RI06_9VIRU|nr:MAG TPA: hypothetical protein [virus sp. ctML55]DAV59965.1 MAG TPA: hypothetical protein [Caudoviricetes sp.]DAW91979.1 MAG TPA: hypothetical protein [Bacteriophage sp.]
MLLLFRRSVLTLLETRLNGNTKMELRYINQVDIDLF